MKYVELDARIGELTGVLSARRYLGALPRLTAELPPGAAAFATDPGHYDFTGQRCVKDLTLSRFDLGHGDTGTGTGTLELGFRHNCWKHEEDLVIRYRAVTGIRLDGLGEPSSWEDLGPLVLDEILPHGQGCTHELAFRPGRLTVTAADLTAEWIASDCPDARRG
ncbi:hypothetical protein [Streptomyces sp. Y1]|uniref:Uncharacterized protein n=1 Tax=Streptomyces sp. Y1 TaxID=3238634 RepID=A0AB39TR72_9ACTN